ncbi:MAG: hypothetical protein H0T46_22825 [Deltaproteobacteria bacterium]|nr:hypothetical protein [Deltaproteobacteria bacterium]
MEPSVTIITTAAKDPDQFEGMLLTERRERSVGWKKFPLRSGVYLDAFLVSATDSDFGVFGSAEEEVDAEGIKVRTRLIVSESIPQILPMLMTMVEEKPDETARALVKHGGGTADVVRVTEALTSGAWPSGNDPAEEAAAFAHQLLTYARLAEETLKGICLEYRGTSVE